MSDQLSKFPAAALLVAQTMLERWEQVRAEGYTKVVGPLYPSWSAAEEACGHALYGADEYSKQDESAYELKVLFDDPGTNAFMHINWVGYFRLSKNLSPNTTTNKMENNPTFPGGTTKEQVMFIVTNIITNDDEIFKSIPYEEYVSGMSEEELDHLVNFVSDNYQSFRQYGGIPFNSDEEWYDSLSGHGKESLQKLIDMWE